MGVFVGYGLLQIATIVALKSTTGLGVLCDDEMLVIKRKGPKVTREATQSQMTREEGEAGAEVWDLAMAKSLK